ncbi:Uncharacterized protein TCM_006353 [Theobroma cacao]|uniref:Uncharacterized protein n=1 Tax=Theobroma cacao TaxID=3641 RepID=A0A061DY08_THECC|nr:Uncharacterized protein TCM_006353 [Theobroma cacao]
MRLPVHFPSGSHQKSTHLTKKMVGKCESDPDCFRTPNPFPAILSATRQTVTPASISKTLHESHLKHLFPGKTDILSCPIKKFSFSCIKISSQKRLKNGGQIHNTRYVLELSFMGA